MKRLFLLLSIIPLAALARPVSEEDASRAAKSWLGRGCALGKIPASKPVAGVKTLADPESGAELRVVLLEGGGWVVTSADDRVDPILAFSRTGGDVDTDERNPFWALLRADIAAREADAGVERGAGRTTRRGASSTDTTAAQMRWANLLQDRADGDSADARKSLDFVSDLRVDALMQSEWSQSEAGGKNCWNYYTPNNYVCGCVATAYAQIMRKWRYPSSYVTPQTKTCSVDGTSRSFTMKGGYYNWNNMPLKPSYYNVPTDAECQAIGKLTYDVGVSVEMDWASGGSGASLGEGCSALKDVFGYANAVSEYYLWSGWSLQSFKNSVCPSLDAGCPVAMSIGTAHAVVADGYGFSGGDFYIHVNFGWGGLNDAWYCPPNMEEYYGIDGIGCNISPDKTGSILSGRVLGSNGSPVSSADVSLSNGQTTRTDARGVYAFWTSGGSYTVSASKNGLSGQASAYVGSSQTGTSDGNSWGNDITLSGAVPSAPAAPSWVDASDGDYTDKVYVEWAASAGATGYEIFRATSASGAKASLGTTSSTYWNDTTTTAGTTYYYWVKASNDAGTSGFSDYDTGWRASATQNITLQNALDNTTLTFTTGGDADWFGQTSTTYDYEDAAQSGSIGDGESSWMETTVSGQGTLAFWWKTSSESGWDTLALYVDGSQAQLISGDSSWTQVSATVKGSGSHTIRWVYLKDDGTSSGSDCGWVDQVVWTPDGGGGEGEGTAKYALCVGLNEYEDVSSLNGCANDAAFFQASLVERGGWAKADTTLLVNNGATKSAIRSAIANYAAKAVAGDTFVYVHSSHGGQNYGTSVYLCAYDDDYEDTELAEDLARFRSGVKIAVIVDACHSGGLFKGGARKGGAAGIARRVTALMDENRAKSLAKGEKAAASKIASSEIGWVTAADYNESSIDWGFYDTDSWLWDPDAEGVDYGGTFIGSFVWSWWNDTADYCDVGDGDGYADPYECWRVAYDFCTGLDSFWDYSGESFTPQYLNESALRKVELGSSGGGRVILPRPTIPEAVDNTTLAFTTGGSANWFGQSTTTHDGADAAQSGYIDNSQSSWMQTTVSGSGTLSFWWKVSSEEDYDYLRLYIDGALVREISGSTSWQQVTLSKTWVGTHTIRWTYSKDYSVSDDSDCGWVDQVTWTPAPRTLTPVYRFYSPRTKGHFFTMNEAEKNNLIATASHIWNFEGIAYYAYQTQLAGTVPLYRFYSPRTRGHFYTKSEAEKNSLIATASHIWNFEGISYFVAASRLAGTTPIYRFWAPGAKHHFYTRNEAEKNNLIAHYRRIWNYEGIAFYAWATRAASSDAATVDGGNARTSTLAAAPDWQSAPNADSASSARQRAGVEARGANDPESRDDEGVAATPAAFGLVSLPNETPLPDEGIAESGAVAMEIRAEMPEEGVFASDLDGEWGDGAVSMRLLLPEGLFAIPQLDEETGEVVDGDAEGAVDFELPTSGAWYLLRVKDKAGEEVFSRWMRAAP